MTRAEKIEQSLRAAFQPKVLRVLDESESHRGHAGYQDGGESHFQVTIEAEAFRGMTRVARHRAVHAALGADLLAQVHALALHIDVPSPRG